MVADGAFEAASDRIDRVGLEPVTRLTTGLDLLAAGAFLFLIAVGSFSHRISAPNEEQDTHARRALWRRCRTYLSIAAPVYVVFGLIDRAYQYYRFGSFFHTYISIVAREARQRDPSLPAGYPFEMPFHVGFLGPLFAPEKSIFLFDPLLTLPILLAVVLWRRLEAPLRAYIAASALLLLAYICFYARYTVWSGDFAWGHRYVSTSVQLAALLAVPLLLQHRAVLGRFLWGFGVLLIAVSVAVQLASLAFWLPLEIYQIETLGHPTFVIALRFKNIAAFALGKMDAWGLNNHAMTEDPWDYVHITCWNFLPFLLRRVGVAPGWVVNAAFAVWGTAVAGLGAASLRLLSIVNLDGRE